MPFRQIFISVGEFVWVCRDAQAQQDESQPFKSMTVLAQDESDCSGPLEILVEFFSYCWTMSIYTQYIKSTGSQTKEGQRESSEI